MDTYLQATILPQEVVDEKREIIMVAYRALMAIKEVEEYTGIDFSSTKQGLAIVEELAEKKTDMTKLVGAYQDLKSEVSF